MAARALVGLFALASLLAVHHGLGGRIVGNWTSSMAEGWYWLAPSAGYARGDVVIACAPARFARWAKGASVLSSGTCADVEGVVKRVVAVRGDVVQIDAGGLSVNGLRLTGTRPDTLVDNGSRCSWRAPVPHVAYGRRTLGDEVLLLSDRRAHGYDSRYFGPVPTRRILGRGILVFPSGG